MATFQKISVKDLGGGIDQRSSEDAIPITFSEDLQNVITNSNGFISKRPGYQGFYGFLPLRITSIEHAGTDITFTFDDAVDVSSITSTPIVIFGRLSDAQSGDWSTTDNAEYYTLFTTDAIQTLIAPSGTLIVEHSLDTDDLFTSVRLSDDSSNQDNSFILVDSIDIDDTTPFNIDVNYIVPSNTEVYILKADRSQPAGTTFSQEDSGPVSSPITITAATHGLSNFNIITQHYFLDGAEWRSFEPDEVTVNESTGQVAIAFDAALTSDIKTLLSSAPADNFETATISASSTGTIVISTTDSFHFFGIYKSSGGSLTKIIPDSIVTDSDADTITISIINSDTSSLNIKIFYEVASISTSSITVTDNGSTSATYTDTNPQLTLWGISHENIYNTSVDAEGHTTHIDTYRREAEERLVTGLGGNLFTARTRAESGATHLIPTTEIAIDDRVNTDVMIGPAFISDTESSSRTRGVVQSSDISSNAALITAVEFISSGVTKYTLSLTGKVGDLSTTISVTTDKEDFIVITGMAHDKNNGTFKITAVDNSANTITVANSSVTQASFDETGALGRAGIFTDQIVLQNNSVFLDGDSIAATILGSLTPTVKSSSSTTIVIDGITSEISLTAGTKLFGARTTDVVPFTDTTNFVSGDMMIVSGFDRQMRIKSININTSDISITSITGDGTTATVTSATHNLATGQKILILRSGVSGYNGVHTIASTPSSTTFTFASTTTTTASAGVIAKNTVELDESTAFNDDPSDPDTFSVIGRWITVEAPTSTDDQVSDTYEFHLDAESYESQDILRSTMVADNLYMTNQKDEVMKFDGTNIYQAGLFRWQPQLFAQVDTTVGTLVPSPREGTVATIVGNVFTVGAGQAFQFTSGDRIEHSQDNTFYTVVSVDDANNALTVDSTISGSASGTINAVTRYRYYFRLNAIDANNNIIASAATGVEDFTVDLGGTAAQIKMRLVGFPLWGIYDYDSLELEVYRTKADQAAPFFRTVVKDISFSLGDGYIDVTDDTIDDLLSIFDSVNTALKGNELGTAWTQPLRAKYLTSTDNKLILGNVKDYPKLDIVLRPDGGTGTLTAADLDQKRLLLRKSNTDTETTTNMVDRAAYEFVDGGAVTIVPNTAISKTSTTFTVTDTHSFVAGDWVYMYHNAAGTVNSLTYAGWWQINSVSTTVSFTIKANMDTTAVSADVDRYVSATTKQDIPVWLGTDGNYNQVDGNTINEASSMIRMANAINASMRLTDTSLTSPSQTAFIPWVIAGAGSEFGPGQLALRTEKVESTTLEALLPADVTGATWFVNSIAKAGSTENQATTTVLSSRVLISYANFPEIFDNPFGDQINSDSIVDINAADGQEITGIIPFFGEAAFGASQVESVLVVFKTNSIYLLNLATREIQKIQSRGLGCTAPFSIATTRDGIMFANNSGIYRLNRNQSISYVGKAMERFYQDDVNRDQLSKMTGHHNSIGRQYKLSLPFGNGQIDNNQVFVYDHQREGAQQEFGAWTRFTNHPATGWANLGNDSFFSTTKGQVFSVRRAGDASDFRDDGDAVATMVMLLRAESFDQPGTRKTVGSVVSHFQLRNSSIAGVLLESSPDLSGVFSSAGIFTATKDGTNKISTIKSSLPRRKLTYIQLKYTDSTKDQDLVLTGLDYSVTLLTENGIPERVNVK